MVGISAQASNPAQTNEVGADVDATSDINLAVEAAASRFTTADFRARALEELVLERSLPVEQEVSFQPTSTGAPVGREAGAGRGGGTSSGRSGGGTTQTPRLPTSQNLIDSFPEA